MGLYQILVALILISLYPNIFGVFGDDTDSRMMAGKKSNFKSSLIISSQNIFQ